MKKILISLLLVVALSFSAFAKSTEEKTADAVCVAGKGFLTGFLIATDATNAVTVSIYDSASGATGKKLIPTCVITTSATDRVQYIGFDSSEVPFINGVYVDITTAGTCAYVIYYRQ